MTAEAGQSRAVLEVVAEGLLTTVQDAGRPDWTHLGVPESGAADPWSLAVANLLIGNEPDAATLELTLVGGSFRVRRDVTIGLAGADLGGRVRGGRRLVPGRGHHLAEGDVIDIAGATATVADGARLYLAVPGGIDVPLVLGSRSTCLPGGFGGLDGRPLRRGDLVSAAAASLDRIIRPELAWPTPDELRGSQPSPRILRVVPAAWPGLEEAVSVTWRVAAAADRVGLRLDGDPLPVGIGGEVLTHGLPGGAIQVPPDGRPIVLGADHQVTGGYRVIGVVIAADRPILGQLRPGSPVKLAQVDRETALVALRAQTAQLTAGAAALREALGWEGLVDAAGG